MVGKGLETSDKMEIREGTLHCWSMLYQLLGNLLKTSSDTLGIIMWLRVDVDLVQHFIVMCFLCFWFLLWIVLFFWLSRIILIIQHDTIAFIILSNFVCIPIIFQVINNKAYKSLVWSFCNHQTTNTKNAFRWFSKRTEKISLNRL